MIAEYATLYFIKEIMKGNNQVYMTIQETVKIKFIFKKLIF